MSGDFTKSGSKRKGGANKKGGQPSSQPEKKAAPDGKNDLSSLVRDPKLGMMCRPILTGYYGSRGERIKHTVHDGALRMPKQAISTIEHISERIGGAPPSSFELPAIDSVVRPCMDTNLETITVTELTPTIETVTETPEPDSEEATPTPQLVERTKIRNRTIRRVLDAGSSQTERIRGGGGEDPSKMDVDTTNPASPSNINPVPGTSGPLPAPVNTATSTPATVVMTAPPAVSAPPMASVPHATSGPPIASAPLAASAPHAAPAPLAAPVPHTASAPHTTYMPSASAPPGSFNGVSAMMPPPQAGPSNVPAANPSGIPPAPAGPPTTTPVGSSEVVSASSAAAPIPSSSATGSSPSGVNPAAEKVTSAAPGTSIRVNSLKEKPAPEWDQYKPGPNDETVSPPDQLTPKPAWYKKDDISNIERAMLPEWFDSSAHHRTPETYKETREKIIAISETIANRNVTTAMVRRSVTGDVGSLQRLRNFLTNWCIINEDAINDSAATPAALREEIATPKIFNQELRDELMDVVVKQSKRQRIEKSGASESTFVPIDWEEVAREIGHGTTSTECEHNFLSMPINDDANNSTERSITPDGTQDASKHRTPASDTPSLSVESARQELILELLKTTSGDVVKQVTETALKATDNNVRDAQSAALLGLVTSRALEEARAQENSLSSVLSQLISHRMEKLENRMAMIDDVEGMLEAERVALELERRDLYTARCRHWFGGA